MVKLELKNGKLQPVNMEEVQKQEQVEEEIEAPTYEPQYVNTPIQESIRQQPQYIQQPTQESIKQQPQYIQQPTQESIRQQPQYIQQPTQESIRQQPQYIQQPIDNDIVLKLHLCSGTIIPVSVQESAINDFLNNILEIMNNKKTIRIGDYFINGSLIEFFE